MSLIFAVLTTRDAACDKRKPTAIPHIAAMEITRNILDLEDSKWNDKNFLFLKVSEIRKSPKVIGERLKYQMLISNIRYLKCDPSPSSS